MINNQDIGIVYGVVFFGILVISVVSIWSLYNSGEAVSREVGIIEEVHRYSAKGSLVEKATVILESGTTVKIVCNNCRKGDHVSVLKRKNILESGYVYEQHSIHDR